MSMTNQNIFDKKKLVARNFRFICDFRGISQDEVVKRTGIPRQNVNVWYNVKGNPNPEYFDKLSKLLQVSRETFSVENLTKEYLEKHFPIGNSTHRHNETDNPQNQMGPDQFLTTFKSLVEGTTEYLLIPRGVLKDNYRLISLEQYQKDLEQIEKEKQQIEKDREQIQIFKHELDKKDNTLKDVVKKADQTIAAKEETIRTLNRLLAKYEGSPADIQPQQGNQ
jgi:transcriptional regulator with XRE-family HTH domain